MSTLPPFFNKNIGLECFTSFDENNVLRGMELAGYGRVKLDTLAVAEGSDLICIKSLVSGSSENYTCDIILSLDSLLGEYTLHESRCTCPHGNQCKHCAAILLLLTADWSTGKPVPRWTPSNRSVKLGNSLVELDSDGDDDTSVNNLFFKKTSPPRNYPSEYKICLPRKGSPWRNNRNPESSQQLPLNDKRLAPEPLSQSEDNKVPSPPHKRRANSAMVNRPTFASSQVKRKVKSDKPSKSLIEVVRPCTPVGKKISNKSKQKTPSTKDCLHVDIDTPKVSTPASRRFCLQDVPAEVDFDLFPSSGPIPKTTLLERVVVNKSIKKSPLPTRQCAVTSTLCSLPQSSPLQADDKNIISFTDIVDCSIHRMP